MHAPNNPKPSRLRRALPRVLAAAFALGIAICIPSDWLTATIV